MKDIKSELEALRAQSETMRLRMEEQLRIIASQEAELKLLRIEVEAQERRRKEIDHIIHGATQLMVQERCAQLKARGVPCFVRGEYIVHSVTGAVLQ